MQEYIQIISQTGFPIFVALYFMLRFEKEIKENTTVLRELKFLIKNTKR